MENYDLYYFSSFSFQFQNNAALTNYLFTYWWMGTLFSLNTGQNLGHMDEKQHPMEMLKIHLALEH